MVVSLGPKSTVVRNIPANPRSDGMGSNPRCLRRDVNKYSAAGARANYTYSAIMDNKDIDSFYNRYLGQPQLKGDTHPWGVRSRNSSCSSSRMLTVFPASQRGPLHYRR
jgi:tyrosinase